MWFATDAFITPLLREDRRHWIIPREPVPKGATAFSTFRETIRISLAIEFNIRPFRYLLVRTVRSKGFANAESESRATLTTRTKSFRPLFQSITWNPASFLFQIWPQRVDDIFSFICSSILRAHGLLERLYGWHNLQWRQGNRIRQVEKRPVGGDCRCVELFAGIRRYKKHGS